MDLTQEYTYDIQDRFRYVKWIIICVGLIFILRLYYLQVIKGRYYHQFSIENSIREVKVEALRGMIFDRNGAVLVDNRPSYNVAIVRQYVVDNQKVVSSLAKVLNIPASEILQKLHRSHNLPVYYPIVVKSDATRDEVAFIESHRSIWNEERDFYDFRGVEVLVKYKRFYPDGEIASHVLGYVAEIDKQRLAEYNKKHPGLYSYGDEIGVMGVEQLWDLELRGRSGYLQKIVDAVGREVSVEDMSERLINIERQDGSHLKLTLDVRLQKLARQLLGKRAGAVVAIDPYSGGVYVMYSSPTFDLNKLTGPNRSEYWHFISSSPKKFLLNRATQGLYPPGSIFKIVTATAALAENITSTEEKIFCPGYLYFGGRKFRCWKKHGHGLLSFVDALAQSCDVFFYTLGARLGVDKIAKYAAFYGLGRKTEIALAEKAGLIPTSSWKEERFGEKWFDGETLSVAIGQGYNLITPLQGAIMVSVVANGGRLVQPHLVEEVFDSEDNVVYKWHDKSHFDSSVHVDKDILDKVRDGLIATVNSARGTASWLKKFGISIAGKTGTAQVVSRDFVASPHVVTEDHAWFVGFAPVDEPKIAVSVLVEHGGHGSTAAAPIAAELMKRFLELRGNHHEEKDVRKF